MQVVINGSVREFPDLVSPAHVADLIASLELKGDRVAIEHNGAIVRRPEWETTRVAEGDRFEVVHFVGGGCASAMQEQVDALPDNVAWTMQEDVR